MKSDRARTILITGGAGFIGSNLAERLLASEGVKVRIFDNLSRAGVVRNLRWLEQLARGNQLEIISGDVRDRDAVEKAVAGVTEIYHFAAQVAVTTSVKDPCIDFEVNARGTLNVLDAARRSGREPFFLYTSTNKVYGSLGNLKVIAEDSHFRAGDPGFRGTDESQPLDFHSPYGCSKGTADQYVHDYARIYGLPTVVFRMSCIAGPRQFGTEDQGWVAHFLYSAIAGRPITIYGDGLQVRDILHVHDLVDAMQAAQRHMEVTRGNVYNVGGGLGRAFSIREMLRQIETRFDLRISTVHDAVRPGDQPLYISDTSKLERDTGWHAHRPVENILSDIAAFWQRDHVEPPAQRATGIGAATVLEGVA